MVQRHCSLQHGATPLFVAACCSLQRDLDVHHLVEVGANKDQTMNVGAAPTFIAAQQGHLDGALSNFFCEPCQPCTLLSTCLAL